MSFRVMFLVVQILVIDDEHYQLVTCGTVFQGTCQSRNLANISVIKVDVVINQNEQFVASTNQSNPAVALVASAVHVWSVQEIIDWQRHISGSSRRPIRPKAICTSFWSSGNFVRFPGEIRCWIHCRTVQLLPHNPTCCLSTNQLYPASKQTLSSLSSRHIFWVLRGNADRLSLRRERLQPRASGDGGWTWFETSVKTRSHGLIAPACSCVLRWVRLCCVCLSTEWRQEQFQGQHTGVF